MRSDMNHFEYNPTSLKGITRSRFHMPHTHKTSFNAGDLIPFKVYECLPGDTFSMNQTTFCRMSTPIFPVMDNAYIDVYWFFIPSRLTWIHTKEFYGENTEGPWAQDVEYEVPIAKLQSNAKGSIYDQLCIPQFGGNSTYGLSIDFRPIRAYALIWNEWFRDQNVSAPLHVDLGDSILKFSADQGNSVDWLEAGIEDMTTDWYLGIPLPVAKFHDYFTSALPQPQKGPAVSLPVADDSSDLPVYSGQSNVDYASLGSDRGALRFLKSQDYRQVAPEGNVSIDQQAQLVSLGDGENDVSGYGLLPANLYADVSGLATLSVNDLRKAVAMQRLFEKDARAGTRFREIIQSHFGVKSADARVQVPEFLAGKRVPINMTSVPQTSATNSVSPQGNLSAYSVTKDKNSMFTYSVTEPGWIMGLCCVRTDQSYSQGLHRMWSRRRKYDFYWPVFANLGEQPIYNKELFYDNSSSVQSVMDETFGFQEAWAEYRYQPNTVAGALRPNYNKSLSFWTYAQKFTSTPTLSPNFIYETKDNVDRTLAVKSNVEDQFICDFFFDLTVTRPMPLYSIPGLADHY